MVEYIASQDRCLLNIEANYYNQLDIEAFSQMMKDPSYCYKFYWLEAVVHIISEGKNETTFDEIIDEMIANAWYSVREFHIHLSGIQADGLVVMHRFFRHFHLMAMLSAIGMMFMVMPYITWAGQKASPKFGG